MFRRLMWFGVAGLCLLLTPVAAVELVANRMTPDLPVFPQFFSVTQGPDRSIYLGGSGSLLRYDGGEWRSIEVPNDGPVRELHTDRHGRIWVGGFDFIGVLERQRDGRDLLRVLDRPDGMSPEHRYMDIWRVLERDEGIYFGALRDLMLYRHDTEPVRHWHHPGRFGSMISDAQGLLLQLRGEGGGMHRLVDGEFQTVPGGAEFTEPLVYNLQQVGDDQLLLHDITPRLSLWQDNAWQPVVPKPSGSDLEHLTTSLATPDSRVIFGGDDGVLRVFDPGQPGFDAIRLGGGYISDLQYDRDGALLVVDALGLARIEQPAPWLRYSYEDGLRGGVHGIVRQNDDLWLQTEGGVFQASAPFGIPSGSFVRQSWTVSEAWDLLALDDRLLLAESYGLREVLRDGTVRALPPDDLYPRMLLRSRFDANRIWVGTEHGIALLQLGDFGWRLQARLEIPGELVNSMVELEGGQLLMGVSGSGLALARLSEEGGAVPALELQPLSVGSTANVSRLGDLVVVSTPDGIQRWQGDGMVPFALDGLEDLRQSGELLLFEQARDGARWAIGFANVYAQPPGGQWSLVFSAAPGDGPLTALELLDDGRALVGGNGQLLVGSLPRPRSEQTSIVPRLTSVILEPDQGTTRMLNLDEPAVLGGGAGVLRFHVGFPDFATGANPQYRFRLLGLGEGWSEWSGLSSFTVAALDSGSYELQYQARRQRGQHLDGVAFPVTVVPRWYERRSLQVFAAALLALLVGLGFSLRYRRRAKRLARQNIELDQLVRQRTFDLEQANVRLRDQAERDGLTGVANRRLFDQHLAKAIGNSQASGAELCLLLCDVDHFKEYNDSRGHLAGDEMLVCIAQVLVGHVRGDTLVARYGGEEFALVAQRCNMDAALQMAERLRVAVEAACGGTTVSIGVAQFDPETTQSGQSLIERADGALYQAKRMGRNRVERG